MEVGFAKTDITPDEDSPTIYQRSGPTERKPCPIRDRLYARATAFRSGDTTAVWVTTDTIAVSGQFRQRVTSKLAECGIPADHVVLSATHTHTAPTVVHFHGVVPTPDAYLDRLESAVVDTALAAAGAARPAEVSFGKASVDLSVNRREIGRVAQINDIDAPTGLVDPSVTVATFRLEDGRAGCLFNYAAHPLTMTQNTPCISADYPGRAAAQLEAGGGLDFAQFLQGCSGNINAKIHGDAEESEEVGKRLAEAVLEASASAKPSGSSDLRATSQVVQIPWSGMPTADEARATLERERAKQAEWPRQVEWAQAVCDAFARGDVRPYGEALVQALRVGDAVFVALPGEVFVEIGLAIKQRTGVERTFVAAYSNNGEIGYIPTAAAFDEGGYETDTAPLYYGLFRLSPECERIMVEAGLAAATRVW